MIDTTEAWLAETNQGLPDGFKAARTYGWATRYQTTYKVTVSFAYAPSDGVGCLSTAAGANVRALPRRAHRAGPP